MCKGDRECRIAARSPGNSIGEPIPYLQPVPWNVHAEPDIPAATVDARFVDIRIGVCLHGARTRLIADDGVAAHPGEEAIVRALVHPTGVGLSYGPAIAGSGGHGADIDALGGAAIARVGVIGRGWIVGEGKGNVYPRNEWRYYSTRVADPYAPGEVHHPPPT